MQGYIRVSTKGSNVALKWNSPSYKDMAEGEHDRDHDKHDEKEGS